ncbi:hypothetical protein CcaCcLH18_00640 [Colletotrichum camelliae]|nr:hypothetical protein CcaCcLH18_00640 [Colletotrichum camelliae]
MKIPTDISVYSMGEDGTTCEVKLTSHVWENVKSQNQREAVFIEISSEYPDFPRNCQNYIFDLRNYGSNKGSRTRLEDTGHKFYMGKPYFNDNDKAQNKAVLKKLDASGNLATRAKELVKKGSQFFKGTVLEAKNIQEAAYIQKQDSKRVLAVTNSSVYGLPVHPNQWAIVLGFKWTVRAENTVEKGGNISTSLFGGLGIIFVFQKKAGLQV